MTAIIIIPRSRRSFSSRATALVAAFFGLALLSSSALAEPVTITAKSIPAFRADSDRTHFGDLKFVGGFSFTGSSRHVAGLSGLVVGDGGTSFLAVTDYGYWISGRIARDESGVPSGLVDVDVSPMRGPDGRPLTGKIKADAEGLARRGDQAVVSFERAPRILDYPVDPSISLAIPRERPQPIPNRELRANQGLEALAASPPGSPLQGALVTVAEGSIDRKGNLFAAIVDGPHRGVFKIAKDEKWNVSDADFLPDGDLLLLERRYEGIFGGLGVRLRRIDGRAIKPGALLDGPVIFEANLSEEIDNMEGLSVWQDAQGVTRLTLNSDDNGSFFQRNLLLEFILTDKKAGL
ncbi:esterase-like activity of phytase family protein [Fulvimarina sp. MAC3]|uniref:esterase-like activity of phytase family protein n=1 Tax=Fulvimarina sp. MAC3 TaxID=3148887 RepID=UPI0031FC678B